MTSNINVEIRCTGILTIVFIALKLLGKIDWSWWWVLSPLWISTIITLIVLIILMLIIIIIK